MYAVILLFALFGSLFTLQKETLQHAEPFFLVGARMTFAGILLLAFVTLVKKEKINFTKDHILAFLSLSLANIYLTNICEIWGIQHMVSSKACLIYSLSPFLAALVAFIVLKETLTKKKGLGMLIGFLGLIPIHFSQSTEELVAGNWLLLSSAEFAILGAVLFSVYGWILLKKIISTHKYSPLMANGVSMAIGGILALMHSYLSGEAWNPIPVQQMSPFIINSLFMCLISNLICYNLYGYLLKKFTATFMSFAGLVTPLFASAYGYLFLGETVTWHFFASISLFSLGLGIFYIEEIKRGNAYKVAAATA